MESFNRLTAASFREKLQREDTPLRRLLAALFDEGTFAETDAFIGHGGMPDPVVCGYGAVGGKLTYVFAQDGARQGGFGCNSAAKITAVIGMARRTGAPVIGIFDSAGAEICEGAAALSAYGDVMRALSDAAGEIPRIALITGVCGGAASILAGLCDFTVAVKGASLYVNPPFLLKHKGMAANIGRVSLYAAEQGEAVEKIRHLLSFLPANDGDETPYAASSDDANRLTPELDAIIAGHTYDAKDVIALLCDSGSFFEIRPGYAPEMVTGFARMNGLSIGICANNPAVLSGAVTPDAARKASEWIDYCSAFDIPLLTLCDTYGYDLSEASESDAYHEALASLAFSYACADCPSVTAVLGRAYGAAFTVMGSKSVGADVAIASDHAVISVMEPDAAVQFLYADQIRSAGDPAAVRASLTDEWVSGPASPVAAAASGDIDDIIPAEAFRQRIASAFEALICAR